MAKGNTNAATAAQRYLQAMADGRVMQKYKDSINSTTVNPMALAASQQSQQLYMQNTAAAVTSGRMAKRLNETPVQAWKDGAINKGAARLSSGAAAAANKVNAHFAKWMPIYKQVSDAVQSMPKGGVANAQARSSRAIQMLMEAAGKS